MADDFIDLTDLVAAKVREQLPPEGMVARCVSPPSASRTATSTTPWALTWHAPAQGAPVSGALAAGCGAAPEAAANRLVAYQRMAVAVWTRWSSSGWPVCTSIRSVTSLARSIPLRASKRCWSRCCRRPRICPGTTVRRCAASPNICGRARSMMSPRRAERIAEPATRRRRENCSCPFHSREFF